MFTPRSLFRKFTGRSRLALLVALIAAIAVAVPVFAANPDDNSNGGGTTLVLDKPAVPVVASGDLMIANIAYKGTKAGIDVNPPSGWTLVAEHTNTSAYVNLGLTQGTYQRIATAADVSGTNYTWSFVTGGTATPATVSAVGGIVNHQSYTVDQSATNPSPDGALVGSTSVDAPSVTTTHPNERIAALYAFDTGATMTPPAGMTERYDFGRTGGTTPRRIAAADGLQAVAGASGTKTGTASAITGYTAQTISLRPNPTKLAYTTSPRTGQVHDCLGPITVRTENADGAADVLADTEVTLASNGTGSFFSEDTCSTALTQANRTISTGGNNFSFYYKPTARNTGTHQLTATATGLTQAQQNETVNKDDQLITFAQPPSPKVYGSSFSATPTSDSGLTVTLTPTGGCSVSSGTQVTMTSGTVDCVLTASQDGNDDYNAASPVQRTVEADPRPVQVTADPQTKVYGEDDPDLTYQITTGNTMPGDNFSGALTRDAGESVTNSPYAITQGTLTLGSNYDLSYVGDDLAITKKQLTVDADPDSKVYGATDPAFTATLNGFENGETRATAAGFSGSEDCSRTGVGTDEDVDTYVGVITCDKDDLDADNYSFANGSAADFTITPKQLTVDADPDSKVYGATDPSFTATINGFEFGEDRTTAAGFSGSEICSRTGVGTDEDVDVYDDVITCDKNDLAADNYSFANGSAADFTITPKQLTVDADPDSKVYGADDPDFTATLNGFENGEDRTSAGVTGSEDCSRTGVGTDEDVDTYVGVITCDKDDLAADNYSFANGSAADFTITPKQLTVDADPDSKVYGATDPAFTATLNGFENGETRATAAGFSGSEDCSRTGVGTDEDVDTYVGVITCDKDDLAADNYSFANGSAADFTITQKPITGHFTADDKDYDGTTAATVSDRSVSGEETGDDVDLSGGTATFASPDVDTNIVVTLTGASLSGTDAGNYSLGSVNTDTANIDPVELTVDADPKSKVYGATDPAFTATLNGFVNGENRTSAGVTGSETCGRSGTDENVGTYPNVITCDKNDLAAANYSFANGSPADFTITKKTLNVNAADKSKVYGAADPTFTSSLSGFVSGEDATNSGITGSAACTREGGSSVAGSPYTITCAPGSLAAANYSFATGALGDLTITRKSVTGSFTAADKDYDGTTAATITSRSLSGAIAGDVVALVGGTATFGNANPGEDKFVSGTGFTLGGADAGNYSLASVGDTTATIRQRDPGGQENPPTEEDLEQGAEEALGGDVKTLDLGLDLASVFAPEDQTKKIKAVNQELFAIGCLADCEVGAKKKVVLTVPDGGASAAATKKIRLKPQNMSLAAGEIGVVKLKLTRKQKKAIRKATKARLVVKLAVESGGQTETGKKTYRLKATKG